MYLSACAVPAHLWWHPAPNPAVSYCRSTETASCGYPTISSSLSLFFALWVSSAPCQRITFSYLGFPPGSYSATSAPCHLCQVLLPTTSTLHQFVPVCPRATSLCVMCFFFFFRTWKQKWKRKTWAGEEKIHFFPGALPYMAFFK